MMDELQVSRVEKTNSKKTNSKCWYKYQHLESVFSNFSLLDSCFCILDSYFIFLISNFTLQVSRRTEKKLRVFKGEFKKLLTNIFTNVYYVQLLRNYKKPIIMEKLYASAEEILQVISEMSLIAEDDNELRTEFMDEHPWTRVFLSDLYGETDIFRGFVHGEIAEIPMSNREKKFRKDLGVTKNILRIRIAREEKSITFVFHEGYKGYSYSSYSYGTTSTTVR